MKIRFTRAFASGPFQAVPDITWDGDSAGHPCILLAGSNGHLHAPIRLAGIEVHFALPCRIAADGQERQETLTVVACSSTDIQSQRYFLHICETIVKIVGATPTLQEIIDAVGHLVELFRQLSRPASGSVIGLIGELFTIRQSSDAVVAVRAWRSADDDRFDFAIDDARLEVKASGDRVRAHNLSAEQCQPPSGTVGALVSLFVELTGGGMSLMELIEDIVRRLEGNDQLILKIQETVAATLGETTTLALSTRFDDRLAESSLRLYELSAIPAIRSGIPPEVTQVRFRSDLSRAPTVSIDDLTSRCARFFDLFPST